MAVSPWPSSPSVCAASSFGLATGSAVQTRTCPSAHPVTSLHCFSSPPSAAPPGLLTTEQSRQPTGPLCPVSVCTQHCPPRSQILTSESAPDVTKPSIPLTPSPGRKKATPVTGPRWPSRRNRPVSATTSHSITTPSALPLASLPTPPPPPLSNFTICTGDEWPLRTRGSRHANSSVFPKKFMPPSRREWTSPLSVPSPPPDGDANFRTSAAPTENTLTDPSAHPVATLVSSLLLSSPGSETSTQTTCPEFSALPVPTPPLRTSRCPTLKAGSPRRRS